MTNEPLTNQQLATMGPWLHDFALPKPLTIPIDPSLRKRIAQRSRLIVPRLLEQFPGGRLDGVRVLDLGANAGFWARTLAGYGANVTCVEPRAQNIAQARAIATVLGDANLQWVQQTAEDFLVQHKGEQWHLVLNMGLLYHAADAIGLMQLCAAATQDLLLVDSHCINDDGACIELHAEASDELSQGVASAITLPSRGAVYWMLRLNGFAHILENANVGDVPADYSSFQRCTFFGRRTSAVILPAGELSRLTLHDQSLAQFYGPLGAAGSLERMAPRPRAADFYSRRGVRGA